MNTFPQWIWIALVAVAVLVAILALVAGVRRSRSERLREHFGNEYDRTVHETGSRAKGEKELVERAEEVERFNIRPLTAAERDRYVGEWKRIEQRFVDRPKSAVAEADELLTDVMRMRGYPMADFERHAAYLSVKHPRILEHYRAGHAVIDNAAGASTETLRQAMLHYRTLFEELVHDGADVAGDVRTDREVVEPSPRTGVTTIREEEERPRQ
jgi:hypothetical protein